MFAAGAMKYNTPQTNNAKQKQQHQITDTYTPVITIWSNNKKERKTEKEKGEG